MQREPLSRARERDVCEPALGLEALAGGALLRVDLERAAVRELLLLAGEQVHLGPLTALGAVDRGQLDPAGIVADRAQRVAAASEQLRVLEHGLAAGFLLRLLEHLELDLLGVAEGVLVGSEVLVEPAGATQVGDEPVRVGDRGQRVENPAGVLEPEPDAGVCRPGGETGGKREAGAQPACHLLLGTVRQSAAWGAADERDVVGLARILRRRAQAQVGLERGCGRRAARTRRRAR